MPLRAHLAELRRRFVRSALAIVVLSVAGWFLYTPLYAATTRPLDHLMDEGILGAINFPNPVDAFNLRVQSSIVIGIVLASPIWLYQFWA